MLGTAQRNEKGNIHYQLGDIYIPTAPFVWVTLRNIFNNIRDDQDRQKAAGECYRVLKANGRVILSEGVPAHCSLRAYFE